MNNINWMGEILERRDEFIADLQKLIQIPSVKTERGTKEAPFGTHVKEALDYMLSLGGKDGFTIKNTGNVAGHLEIGSGDGLIGVLCHVDVVPAGDGWTHEPFGGELESGKLFGRGAIDDKGPTMAAYYAMKIVKELGIPLEKRVRMIIGTDEESDWQCVERYFETEEMPDIGFAPDADFPIIFAEKGIADVQIKLSLPAPDEAAVTMIAFESGERYNMVPDFARASLLIDQNHTLFLQNYTEYINESNFEGNYHIENGAVVLEMKGTSAHAMEPDFGQNAALMLARFLSNQRLDTASIAYIDFMIRYFDGDTRGRALGIAATDLEMGDVTVNAAIFRYEKGKSAQIGVNVRYPVSFSFNEEIQKLKKRIQKEKAELSVISNSEPHYVQPDDPLIETLKRVYEEETGKKADLLSIGGGTYARALKTGVAFGALFPGRPDVAHQKDEYAFVEDLFQAAAIYARTIVELAGKNEKE
ncbi:dipeptidase PepV [Domibacillus aminovorans]|uniref:Dipeptidase PepV n=1 Tax=Domibacillus aminovorans TaxID=29332 RepID=A0A177KSD2_9BACI|nr:dipeptidase PepV [Domibacillus aminovorans]OAH56260.1 dipeptidase PepV [Domibacillus aminovorans]